MKKIEVLWVVIGVVLSVGLGLSRYARATAACATGEFLTLKVKSVTIDGKASKISTESYGFNAITPEQSLYNAYVYDPIKGELRGLSLTGPK